jgi:hypothetical protein
MPVEDLLRDFFTREADRQPSPAGLYQRAVADGMRLRRRRRAGQLAGSVILAGAAASAVILAPAWGAGSQRAHAPANPHVPLQGTASPSSSSSPAAPPWWQTWPAGRSYGTPPSSVFLAALAPGAHVQVYADGTLPDGEEFAMYLVPATGHAVQYSQGWGNSPDYGTGESSADPQMNDYIIQLASTAAARSETNNSTWAIVIGRPGTTAINYSVSGGPWQPMHISNGIGVLARASGQPAGIVVLRFVDASGQYAQVSFRQFAPPTVTHPA